MREQTDRIFGAANAVMSTGYGLLQVAGIVLGLSASVVVLYAKLYPKYEEWKRQSAAPPQRSTQTAHSSLRPSTPSQTQRLWPARILRTEKSDVWI